MVRRTTVRQHGRRTKSGEMTSVIRHNRKLSDFINDQEIEKLQKIESYNEKKERRIERYKELSKRKKRESESTYKHARKLSSVIPFGQPILVGHHSEKRDRNFRNRIDNTFRRSFDLDSQAEFYKNKAKRLEEDTVISSDDPDAVNKLKKKLNLLLKKRERIKAFNKKARKEKTEQTPSYVLRNLSGNVKSVKDRIAHLEHIAKLPDIKKMINGIVLSTNKDDNRVRLKFDGKPDNTTIRKLKKSGFRWSPRNQTWQRHLNDWSIHLAKEIADEYKQD
tara:strand:- start:2396 stop:3229 length:834 start_codon:yes stop_codon:yes gene_type:complete